MICVTLLYNGFITTGHGDSIACASVSVLTQAITNGLIEQNKDGNVEVQMSEDSLIVTVKEMHKEIGINIALLDTLAFAILQISEQYPDDIKIL